MESSVKERAKLLEQQSNRASFPYSRPSPQRPSLVPKSIDISTPHFDGREVKQDLFRLELHSNSTALRNAKILSPAPPQHSRSLSTDGRLQNSKAKPPPPVPSEPNNIQRGSTNFNWRKRHAGLLQELPEPKAQTLCGL